MVLSDTGVMFVNNAQVILLVLSMVMIYGFYQIFKIRSLYKEINEIIAKNIENK